MKPAPTPANESSRQAALDRYDVLDTLPEQDYDDLTRLASHVCGAPIALVSLVDHDRQWFKSRVGIDATETPRDISFCGHVVADGEMLLVADASTDPRFADNPLVAGPPDIRFYAGAPLRTPDGFTLGTLCVIDQAVRSLEPVQVELLHAIARQVMSQMELRRAARAKDDFIGIVSHELRTPLTSIGGALGLLEGGVAGALSERARELVGTGVRNVRRLSRLIDDILDAEKLGAGKMELERASCVPAALVAAACDEMRAMAEVASVTLHAGAVAGGPVWADEDRVLQVLVNLISNAVKFSPEGSTVRVTSTPAADGAVRFAVIDRGPGLSAEQCGRLFGHFAQLETSDAREHGGSGLGLAICKGLVEQHGGRIGVESAPDHGSTFWFELPPAPAAG